jgi:hypothetical protein
MIEPMVGWARIRIATLAMATTLAALSACAHDWDGLEGVGANAATGAGGEGAGGEGAGGDGGEAGTGGSANTTVASSCARYCQAVNDCVIDDSGCQAACEADMGTCSKGHVSIIDDCLDTIDSSGGCSGTCAGWIGFNTCIGVQSINCWTPPYNSC